MTVRFSKFDDPLMGPPNVIDIEELGEVSITSLKPGVYTTNKYDYADFTLEVRSSKKIELTIGASWYNRCATTFCKDSLQKMIDDLQVVCNAMEEYK